MDCNEYEAAREAVEDMLLSEQESDMLVKRIEELQKAIHRHLQLCPIKDEVLSSVL